MMSRVFKRSVPFHAVVNPILFKKPFQLGLLRSSIRLQSNSTSALKDADQLPAGKRPVTVDRELPDPFKDRNKSRLQFVGFWVVMAISSVILFNYEKTTSPIVTTTLHFLRRSKITRELLGDEIDFASIFPWISGELNQVKGLVNITFQVKGSKNSGIIRLVADRESKHHDFLIHEWSLDVNGEKTDLLSDKTVDFSV